MTKNKRFMISSPFGFVPFAGVAETSHETYIEISFACATAIAVSKNHKLWTADDILIKAGEVKSGMILKGEDLEGLDYTVTDVSEKSGQGKKFYDILEVANIENSFFLKNGIKSHNCQFLSFEKALISTDFLDFYKIPDLVAEINGFEIYVDKLSHPDSLLLISIDPSSGGEDYSVIQLWELAPRQVIQLGSITDQDLDASGIFEKILWLQEFIKTRWNYNPDDALLLFERNGIGEGLAQILTQTEKAIENLEIPIYYDNKGKAGIHTGQTLKNKLALQFKNLVEYNKMVINDKYFIDELYGFIRTAGGSYAGKNGYHDDRVTAAFLIVYYLLNVFADFASGDFSVDNMMLIKPEDKIVVEQSEEVDPGKKYKERIAKQQEEERLKSEEEELLKKIEAEKKKEREYWSKQASMGSSTIASEDEDDDGFDVDEWDILPTLI